MNEPGMVPCAEMPRHQLSLRFQSVSGVPSTLPATAESPLFTGDGAVYQDVVLLTVFIRPTPALRFKNNEPFTNSWHRQLSPRLSDVGAKTSLSIALHPPAPHIKPLHVLTGWRG